MSNCNKQKESFNGEVKCSSSTVSNLIPILDNVDLNESLDAKEDKKLAEQHCGTLREKETFKPAKKIEEKVYPFDFWCILSKYVCPEDVGRFAGICQGANEAVNTASFWFDLYRRYYREVRNLPQRLQPESMTRLFALRTCVIRTLYYTYQPFTSQFVLQKSLSPAQKEKLVFKECTRVLNEEIVGVNHYSVSFFLRPNGPDLSLKVPNTKSSLNNLYANEDEGCVKFQVVGCRLDYIQSSEVEEHVLVRVEVEHDECTLVFWPNTIPRIKEKEIVFKRIDGVYIHNWWSPDDTVLFRTRPRHMINAALSQPIS